MPHREQCGAPLPEDNSPCTCSEAEKAVAAQGEKTPAPVAEHGEDSRHRHLLPAAIPLILLVGVAVFLVILFSTGSRRTPHRMVGAIYYRPSRVCVLLCIHR